mmetsp:Transcript_54209/g.129166  ORF Transcript_54209/g.129166 Transcript_54209/m.129166 type:complete len:232 (+) Transcript_54209:90-785(+)
MGCGEQGTCPLITGIVLSCIVPAVLAVSLLVTPWYSGSLVYERREWWGGTTPCEQEVEVFAHMLRWESGCNINDDWNLQDHCSDDSHNLDQPACDVHGITWGLSILAVVALIVGAALGCAQACGCCCQQQKTLVWCGAGWLSFGAAFCIGAFLAFTSVMSNGATFIGLWETEVREYTVDVDIGPGWFIALLASLLSLAAVSVMCLAGCKLKVGDGASGKGSGPVVVGNPVA